MGIKVKYSIDRIDIRSEYGVFISKSSGLFTKPKFKKFYSHSWAEEHGDVVDLRNKKIDVRKITLECFIIGENIADFEEKTRRFIRIFDKERLNMLLIEIESAKPLVYMVYLSDTIDISKKWVDGRMVGTFNLSLIEPEPVKRVERVKVFNPNSAVNIEINGFGSPENPVFVNCYTGDDSEYKNVMVNGNGFSHTYKNAGTYYFVITGNLPDDNYHFAITTDISNQITKEEVWHRI